MFQVKFLFISVVGVDEEGVCFGFKKKFGLVWGDGEVRLYQVELRRSDIMLDVRMQLLVFEQRSKYDEMCVLGK